MLTIAGGILLAVLAVITVGIWGPMLAWLIVAIFWLLVAAVVLGIGYAVVSVIIDYPQESIEIGTYIGILFFFIFSIAWLQGWWDDKRRKKINKINQPYHLKILRDEFGKPNVLARNKNRNEMIALALRFEVKVDENDTKSDIAKKIFGIKDEANEETLKAGISPAKDRVDVGESASILGKIDQVRKKEVARLNKLANKERNEKKILVERFSKINLVLRDLKQTYSKDEDIDIEVYDNISAYLTMGPDTELYSRDIFIELSDLGEGFRIRDSEYDYEDTIFDETEGVVDYIVEQVGKYLADRESQ
jgi:hypothetical protein